MFRALIRFLPLPVLLVLFLLPFVARPASTDSRSKRPPKAAILFLPTENFAWPNAIPLLIERALDARGIRFEPVVLPRRAAANLAGLLAHTSGREPDVRETRFLRAESRSRGFDTLLLLREERRGGRSLFILSAATGSFEETIEVEGGEGEETTPPEEIAQLLDKLISLLHWPTVGTAPYVHGDLASEERYARVLAAGSPALFREIMEGDSLHEAARLHFAGRLALGEFPSRGGALLDSIDSEELPALERSALGAWRAAAAGDERSLNRAVAMLEDRFPGRFETRLLQGILAGRKHEWDEGEEALRKAAEMRPLDPLPHRLIGDIALQRGFLELAAREYRSADNLGLGDPLARIGLASVHYSEGRIDEAESLLIDPPPPFPHHWTARFLYSAARSNLYLARGLFDRAEETLLQARDEAYRLGNEEALIDLTVRLCHVYLEGGLTDAAASEVGELRFRGAAAGLTGRQPGLVPYLEGLVGVQQEDFGTVSAKKLEIETTAGANEAWTEHLEGRYLLERGAAWEAVPYLRSAARLDGSLVNNLHLGRALLAAGQTGNARRTLELIVEQGESLLDSPPSIPLAFYYLGRSLEELGDPYLARLAFREFLTYWHNPNQARSEWRHANNAVN